jgi:vacuolar-type H+-ATPase subunit I/STV1
MANMKLTVRQLKQLIAEEVKETRPMLLTEAGHAGVKKKFEKAAGAYLRALIGEGWSRFDAVAKLVSQLRTVFKTIKTKSDDED